MAGNTSAIIVVMVAVCMVAVTVPAVMVATQDDGTFQVDVDVSIVKDDLTPKIKEQIIAGLSDFGGDWSFSSNGKHVGSNNCPNLDRIGTAEFAKIVSANITKFVKGYKCVCLDEQEHIGEYLSDYSLFKIIEDPQYVTL